MKPTAIIPVYMDELKTQGNISVLTHNDSHIVYQIEGIDGTGTVEVFTLFPGVVMQFHDFCCKSFRLKESKEAGNSLKINYCTEGRMEVMMSDNMYLFMEPGNLSIDIRKAQNSFQFPCGYYHGVELVFHSSALNKDIPELLKNVEADGEKIKSRFCKDTKSYVIKTDERLHKLFEDMRNAPSECYIQYLKIKVAELLLLLCTSDMPKKSDVSSFMTTGQVKIAKQVMKAISVDLNMHYSIESLATSFGISPSSLKKYFQGVYGKNISTWLRDSRINTASTLLKESNQSVTEVAAKVGYENASKFAAAFKKNLGVTPLEYRRQCRCEN